MNRSICTAVLCLAAPIAAWAQNSTACTPVITSLLKGAPSVAADPVSSRLRQVLDCYSNGLIEEAAWVPADKYNQRILSAAVGNNIASVASIGDFACSKISGVAAPKHVPFGKVADQVDKNRMVEQLKSSMEFCKQAFSKLSDAELEESVPWDGLIKFGGGTQGAKVTRFAAALWVTNVLIEHYGALAGYLQISGSLSTLASVPLVEGRFPKGTQPEQSPPLTPTTNNGSSPPKPDNK